MVRDKQIPGVEVSSEPSQEGNLCYCTPCWRDKIGGVCYGDLAKDEPVWDHLRPQYCTDIYI